MTNPTPTDWRALCAELVVIEDAMSGGSVQLSSQGQALDGYAGLTAFRYIAAKARIALTQPEPQGPTDEGLLTIEDLQTAWNAQADAFNSWDELGIDEIVYWAQQQALARWGRPAIEPEPQQEAE